jgi:hypothetical protein
MTFDRASSQASGSCRQKRAVAAIAWLTASEPDAHQLERRRLLKTLVAVGALLVPTAAVYRYAGRRRPIEASDIGVEIVLSWIDEEGRGRGGTIDEAMLNSPKLNIEMLPKSEVRGSLPWKWPMNAQNNAGMQGKAVRLVGQLVSHTLQSSPSTAGVCTQSIRRFGLMRPPRIVVEHRRAGWCGCGGWVPALGLGTNRPAMEGISEDEHAKELTAQAKAFTRSTTRSGRTWITPYVVCP